MQQYAGVYLRQNYSTCFGCLSHPSSGVHQTVSAASGKSHSVRATTFRQRGLIRPRWRWRGGVWTAVSIPPRQPTVANTVRPVPDVVFTVWMCSWWLMRVSSETCRAVRRKYNKTVYSRFLLDNYWQLFFGFGSCLSVC